MNVLVIDIPNVWGMLLSREWATKLGGRIQLDLTYAQSLLVRPPRSN